MNPSKSGRPPFADDTMSRPSCSLIAQRLGVLVLFAIIHATPDRRARDPIPLPSGMAIQLSRNPTREQVAAIIRAGEGSSVAHPRAGNRAARRKLLGQITALGCPRRLALTLRWCTSAGTVAHEEPDAEDTLVDGELVEMQSPPTKPL